MAAAPPKQGVGMKYQNEIYQEKLRALHGAVMSRVVTVVGQAQSQIATLREAVTSAQFEAQLDLLIARMPSQSVDPSAAEAADLGSPGSDAAARKERIQRKLGLLFHGYKGDVLNVAKKSALYGSLFGPQLAIKFAVVAGGIQLIFIVGGIVYTVFLKNYAADEVRV
jgi:hypothetical protein